MRALGKLGEKKHIYQEGVLVYALDPKDVVQLNDFMKSQQ